MWCMSTVYVIVQRFKVRIKNRRRAAGRSQGASLCQRHRTPARRGRARPSAASAWWLSSAARATCSSRIVALRQDKRSLADGIQEGQDQGAPIGADESGALLRDG